MPTYTLITVTYGGAVHHARGFESLRMCQEARSIALTGMTLAENEAADTAYRTLCIDRDQKRRASREAQWRVKHPPRPPTSDERERLKVLQLAWRHEGPRRSEQLDDEPWCGPNVELVRSTFGADGLVYDHFAVNGGWATGGFSPAYSTERGESVAMIRGVWVKKGLHDIRSAHCVIEMPDEPTVPLSQLTPSEAA
ncbi:hypothetical protein ACLBYG_22190 [Methylobacterium sp. D53M]